MILYDYFRSSAAYRVRIAMNLKGLKPEHKTVELLQKLNRTPEYKAINPQGFVPYLVENDDTSSPTFALSQSLAIIEYLDEIHPTPPLLPSNPRDRAFARSISNIIACDIHPLNNPRVLDTLVADFGMTDIQRAQWYCRWIHDGFTAIETLLERNEKSRGKRDTFCVGDMPTVADVCLIPQIANANRFKCTLENFPRIMAINDRALKLEAFDLARPENQRVA
jgi:maleylacetoacetate isomerase